LQFRWLQWRSGFLASPPEPSERSPGHSEPMPLRSRFSDIGEVLSSIQVSISRTQRKRILSSRPTPYSAASLFPTRPLHHLPRSLCTFSSLRIAMLLLDKHLYRFRPLDLGVAQRPLTLPHFRHRARIGCPFLCRRGEYSSLENVHRRPGGIRDAIFHPTNEASESTQFSRIGPPRYPHRLRNAVEGRSQGR
jgi:hypothetical protein